MLTALTTRTDVHGTKASAPLMLQDRVRLELSLKQAQRRVAEAVRRHFGRSLRRVAPGQWRGRGLRAATHVSVVKDGRGARVEIDMAIGSQWPMAAVSAALWVLTMCVTFLALFSGFRAPHDVPMWAFQTACWGGAVLLMVASASASHWRRAGVARLLVAAESLKEELAGNAAAAIDSYRTTPARIDVDAAGDRAHTRPLRIGTPARARRRAANHARSCVRYNFSTLPRAGR
jgi:hypothetical protein